MGLDYALVHLKFTIPPALLLTWLCNPFLNHADRYKVVALVIIAITATIPWDSYLIRTRVWTYPPDAVLGPTLYSIPIEEVFFFFIQTYITSLLYILLSKPTLFPAFLRVKDATSSVHDNWRPCMIFGQVFLAGLFAVGVNLFIAGGPGTYLGIIIAWAVPFLLLMWSLSYQFLLGLPVSKTVLPILVPTIYLWLVDTLALGKGTWVIESGTKYGIYFWGKLDLEEAFFFLVSNMLVVFGCISCDVCFAIMDAFPILFPQRPAWPSPILMIKAITLPTSQYDGARIKGLQDAALILEKKSRSFSIASGVFPGRVRVDLVLLYAFCRAADDLVDDATSKKEAQEWVGKLTEFLDISYSGNTGSVSNREEFIKKSFPARLQASFELLPTFYLPSAPLYSLLDGFRTDLKFGEDSGDKQFPIVTTLDLEDYCSQVASTISSLCLAVFDHHLCSGQGYEQSLSTSCLEAGEEMGRALQLVNIARDLAVDAKIGRVYIPTDWLHAVKLEPEDIVSCKAQPTITSPEFEKLVLIRRRLLDSAMKSYTKSRHLIETLPSDVRAPVRVMVDSYMEIGHVMLEQMDAGMVVPPGGNGRATVPMGRRIRVVWRALQG